ncbi:hypothetical protein MSG28_003913 [Choristoneura fumiferana]|uniref:Uncharacterized protein n=1 Tax=Choristoneura fumiferana TaxID=7141 RepID=A0ACC0KGN0_CHOFU|nr:hypothetical protein MSG28_003913 [Choristoneura fumiferana]
MNQKKYANHIDKAWGLEGPSKSSTEQGWPCVPRRRPHLCSADNLGTDMQRVEIHNSWSKRVAGSWCRCSGIGGMADLKSWVALWDAPRAALRMTSRVSNSDFTLDTMLFSHRTGELVMSLWNTGEDLLLFMRHLVVMSGPQTVVDQWGEGRQRMDRVRTMVFSPDGTKLDNGPSDKTKRRRFSAIPSFIDQSIHGFSVR